MDNQQDFDGKGLERVNVMLDRDLLNWLEELALQLRQDNGATINRSALIRAIVGAFADLKLKLGRCRTESDIREGLFKYVDRLTRGGAR